MGKITGFMEFERLDEAYVILQHVLWNSVTGIFTDLSGFRNGALTVDP